MLKVFITGFDKPYSLSGVITKEDDKFLFITEGGVLRKIPHSRVLYFEETLSKDVEATAPVKASTNYSDIDATISQVVKDQNSEAMKNSKINEQEVRNNFKNSLKKALEERMSKRQNENVNRPTQMEPEPEPPPFDLNDRVPAVVNFTGVKQASFEIEVPRGALTQSYTPALGREIFSYKETKDVLASGNVILDGIPTIDNNVITYKTKNVAVKDLSVNDKIRMAGEMVAIGSKLSQIPNKISHNKPDIFGQSSAAQSFSMPTSPFEKPPTLSLQSDDSETFEEEEG